MEMYSREYGLVLRQPARAVTLATVAQTIAVLGGLQILDYLVRATRVEVTGVGARYSTDLPPT